MAITAADVKALRDKTGAGMMDCKKALTECDGDIAKASEWLREKGIAKAAKKADRIAAEGATRVAVDGNTAVVFEVNSETDFVAKNEQFVALLDKIQSVLLSAKPANMEEALVNRLILTYHKHRSAVLTSTNEEALIMLGLLNKKSVPCL